MVVNRHHGADHRLNAGGVEVILDRIIVGRRGHHYEIRPCISLRRIDGRSQPKRFIAQETFELGIDDGTLPRIYLRDPFWVYIYRRNLIILRQKDRVGQPDISDACDSDLNN